MENCEALAANDNPLAAEDTHFAHPAKNVIMLFMSGAPPHVDTFDYEPALIKADGKSGGQGRLMAPISKLRQRGQSGLWISDLFPNVAENADDLLFDPKHVLRTAESPDSSASGPHRFVAICQSVTRCLEWKRRRPRTQQQRLYNVYGRWRRPSRFQLRGDRRDRREVVEDRMLKRDWHATILHLLGLDHENLTFRYAGRNFRLSNVAG